jgi:starch phosphorylase
MTFPTDPICGMRVDPSQALTEQVGDTTFYFCSELCRSEFRRRPGSHAQPVTTGSIVDAASRRIAYLSMEVAFDPRMPTYSGGLGVLAGDMLRSFADQRIPVVGVTLVHRRGYFRQRLEPDGSQREEADAWSPERLLVELPARVEITIEGRTVLVRAFQHFIAGTSGYRVPVLLLDTDLPNNREDDRRLTDALYGGDDRYRLAQEIVLGVGGRRMLRAAGYDRVQHFHMNEGHASLVGLELLRETQKDGSPDELDYEGVRRRCVFTTHTPVPAGHDRFGWDLVARVLGEPVPHEVMAMLSGAEAMNMTQLALNTSHFVNGVARRHEEVSERMFPGRDIRHVTNGVHSVTWTSAPFRELFDRHIPEWREDPAMLRKAVTLPDAEIWRAHLEAKRRLADLVVEQTGRRWSEELLTIGFARRATGYKRMGLVLSDLERLRALGRGRLAIVFAGKAHPRDEEGKQTIRKVVDAARRLGDDVRVVYLAGYDLELAKAIVAGVDVWLNTPLPPLEASGTSGMKAAHNGVPSLSVLDGWWVEGCIEGVTGWSIGEGIGRSDADRADAADLYRKLDAVVLPTFFERRAEWLRIMRSTIALNASFFNTHRVVQQYVTNAYLV